MSQAQSPEPAPPVNDADRKADRRGLLAIFCALVLGAVHFISGWTFDI